MRVARPRLAPRAAMGWPWRLLAVVLGLAAPSAVLAHGTEKHDDASASVSEEALALAPGYFALNYDAPTPGSYTLPSLGAAADGDVLGTDGRAVSLTHLFDGKLSVLAFIYTRCGDVNGCPLATAVLRRVATRVRDDAELSARVRLLSLSFDPEWDTPERLAEHAESFVPTGVDWRFLTTPSTEALSPVLAAYGQAVTRDPGDETAFSHILRVFLVDDAGAIRNIYSTSFLHPDTVLADLRTLALDAPPAKPAAPALEGPVSKEPATLLANARRPQLGLPELSDAAAKTLLPERIALGRQLFFDRRLSHNGTLSCAMCHVPEQGFSSNELKAAVGMEGASLRRNAPTLLNVGLLDTLFHDGRESSLERQVWQPLLAKDEMANVSIGAVISRIDSLDDYTGRFEAAFDGRRAGMETVGAALASYQRTLLAGNSPFDRWHFAGEQGALSDDARTGFALFVGKAGCAGCHTIGETSAMFTDQRFHNTGLGWQRAMQPMPAARKVQLAPGVVMEVATDVFGNVGQRHHSDLGRYEVTTEPADRWRYRTPSLRNVALTPPYMHDGSLTTLEEVVAFYSAGGAPNPGLDARIRPLNLVASEQRALVSFLKSLTGSASTVSSRNDTR